MCNCIAARLPRYRSAECREIILRRAHGLAAANTGHIVGIAYVRAVDLRRCQLAALRPCKRAAVVIFFRVSSAAGYAFPVIRRQQVTPCAVAVGIAVARAAVFLRAQVAGCVGAGIAVGVYKSAGCRVVVTALEVVERQGQRSDLTSTPPEPRLKGSQFYGEIHGLKKDEDANGLGGAVIGLFTGNVNGVKIVHLADFLLNRDY